jgi:argininosuccinate synthase
MKIALAYSGGLDTSVILHWLRERYAADVVAFIGDVGQAEDLDAIAAKARRTGAAAVRVSDLREPFVREFVLPALQAHAVYESYYLLGTALARPILARELVRVAREEGCDAIAHGATGKGNDQLRFELAARALAPDLRVIAPWREWEFEGRTDILEYARRAGIPVPATTQAPYSMDANLMHISYEGGILEDPWAEPPADMFRMTTDPARAPETPQYVTVEIETGVPVALDGRRASPAQILAELNATAGRHGVGRADIVESRAMGLKSRGVYETPGATVLWHALRAVEQVTLDRELLRLRDELAPRIAHLIYSGLWFAPETQALLRTVADIARAVTGEARLRLYKGSCTIAGRRAPRGLYSAEAASFDTRGAWSPADATGYIRVLGYRLGRHGG